MLSGRCEKGVAAYVTQKYLFNRFGSGTLRTDENQQRRTRTSECLQIMFFQHKLFFFSLWAPGENNSLIQYTAAAFMDHTLTIY